MIPNCLCLRNALQLIFGLLFFMYTALNTSAQDPPFPKSWQGNWQGTLNWYQTGKGQPQQVPMQLKIGPTDSGAYTWNLVYGEAGADSRPYLLLPKDSTGTHWVVDEQNGIILDQYFVGNRLTGAFTVEKTTIVNSYQLLGDSLVVEFHSISREPVATTGSGTEESPTVMSYRIQGYQRAVLRRKP